MSRLLVAILVAAVLSAGLAWWQAHRAAEARARADRAEAQVQTQAQTIRVLQAHYARLEAQAADAAAALEEITTMEGCDVPASRCLVDLIGRVQSSARARDPE
jgi:cytochrome oxidase assembly protein ShyY1